MVYIGYNGLRKKLNDMAAVVADGQRVEDCWFDTRLEGYDDGLSENRRIYMRICKKN